MWITFCSYSDSISLHIMVYQLVIKELIECASYNVPASEILRSALVVLLHLTLRILDG